MYNGIPLKGSDKMNILQGKGVFEGIALGKLSFFKRKETNIVEIKIESPAEEIKRFEEARILAVEELRVLYEEALKNLGEEHAMIFKMQQVMVLDIEYYDSVKSIINSELINAESAVKKTSDMLASVFEAIEDEYMRARGADIKDISKRLIDVLVKGSSDKVSLSQPVIIAAEDLAPSETVQLDKSKVLGFITSKGSCNSHTAILARTMNIPAIIGVGDELKEELDGKEIIIDGFSGKVYVEPDLKTVTRMEEKIQADLEKKKLLERLKGKETVTADGKRINLYANIGDVSDLEAVFANDAEGIGLFRSEFLYLENEDFPTEQQQFEVYKEVAEKMKNKKVIIRTLDIGADKQASYFNIPDEENPAMGYRAIRICLNEKDIFKTQLRALYRASIFGNISIMFPMIISVEEVIEIKLIIKEVKEELRKEGYEFKEDVELGIMIETPASVMISDLLAKEVDFFSVGTNDLTQYTLAIDRQNQKLDKIFNPRHKSILRMLKMVADNAHREGKWVGICGELAADLELTEEFISMGFDELSVSPAYILRLREKIMSVDSLLY